MKPTAALAIGIFLAAPPATLPADPLVQSDLATISSAMEQFYLNTVFVGLPGFFTTVENLDDTMFGTAQRPFDAINADGGALVFRPEDPTTLQRRMLTAEQWGGPYLQSFTNGGRLLEGPDGDYDFGGPFDIRGWSPIYFFTPLGLLEPRTGTISLRYYGDQFDNYALVSFGPDGQFGGGDDIIREITGFPITVPVVSSGRLSITGNPAATLRVRGYNLGSEPGTVIVNGVELTEAPSAWTPTEIIVELNELPTTESTLTVRLASGVALARSAPILVEGEPVAVHDWFLF